LDLEDRLISLLSDPDEESGEATHLNPTAFDGSGGSGRGKEVGVGGGWKKALGKFSSKGGRQVNTGHTEGSEVIDWTADPNDPIHVLRQCAADMELLWEDARVQDILRKRRVRLEETPGFYLYDITRIVGPSYVPSIDDVLKARLKTLGVVEHRFSPAGPSQGSSKFSKTPGQNDADWLIYDVGGARNQRHVWAPFFDDVQALIFLAPISAFDQVLTEDPSVNRMEDSMILWRSIVSSKVSVGLVPKPPGFKVPDIPITDQLCHLASPQCRSRSLPQQMRPTPQEIKCRNPVEGIYDKLR
jgi:G-protein alpha subunit